MLVLNDDNQGDFIRSQEITPLRTSITNTGPAIADVPAIFNEILQLISQIQRRPHRKSRSPKGNSELSSEPEALNIFRTSQMDRLPLLHFLSTGPKGFTRTSYERNWDDHKGNVFWLSSRLEREMNEQRVAVNW
ncbi:hypothetical protein T265_09879 [Opisthorchis viverrini]|uniref:Uncharacterized protein n=1 Tax=Opisthorchis viverrini TaxID=6198 RepID=A0A074Z8J1_OPIVI|nr:hypothetical protein T265_09879 [Opisthorchis viverrini]KER21897.1 hypothetical protein T265_09879 [Opisthorchis viverrini]